MFLDTKITANKCEAVARELIKLLADEFVPYTKTKNTHWNINTRAVFLAATAINKSKCMAVCVLYAAETYRACRLRLSW